MSAPPVDEARAVRAGEELDADKLGAFLAKELGLTGPMTIRQFPGGHSNLTYLVDVGGRELVLRRPPFGSKVKSAHDMGREFRVLAKLCEVYPRAPRPLVHSDDPSVLGAPFYAMERVRGVILRKTPPEGLELGPNAMRRLSLALVDGLAELHALDYRAAGLGDLGKPDGYNRRQVEGWTRRWVDAKTDDMPDVEWIAAWLAERIPKESGAALIHNDWKLDNLVLDPSDLTRIVGALDWEMSTLGDPLMDLGTTLGYWLEQGDADEVKMFAFGPSLWPGALTRRELAERYAEKTGASLEHMLFYYAYALFKTAVVAQQIYARWKKGLTKDARFEIVIHAVRVLGASAVKAARTGAI